MADLSERKTIFVSYKATNAQPCQTDISLYGINFVPDEVTIKNPYYYFDGTEGGSFTVYFGLVNSEIFSASDVDNAAYSEVTYKLNRAVEGTYRLQFLNFTDGEIPTNRAGRLTFILEFKQYKNSENAKQNRNHHQRNLTME